ncbi:TPA: type IV conjugative transfer system protein TraL [Pasteurella multocida]|nr:type IV conjugative transfer system protein TraL [Pasteurella multocida]
MDSQRNKYLFPSTLSNQMRWFGLPVDEAIIYIPVGLLAVFSSMYIFAPTLLILFILIRKMKRGKGSSYILCLMYWFLPHSVSNAFLYSLPPSYRRYWIN